MTRTEQFEQVEANRDRRVFMSNSPRMKFLTACIGAALVQMAGSALADSAVGPDTVIGNAANPGYATGPVIRDADVPFVKRTPSGQMYDFPPARGEASTDGSVTGNVEVGYLYADDRNGYSKRKEYIDQQNNGLIINNFGVSMENAKEANFFSLNGGAVGRNDQFYNLSAGKYNSWKVKAFYNETPHVFSTTFKPLYIDNGTGRPTLNNGTVNGAAPVAAACTINGVVQAASTACTVYNYLATQPLTEIGLIRKKGGARADINLADNWKAYVGFTQENRDGARPFGLQDATAESLEPVHYVTNDWTGGLQYNDGMTAANLRASVSTFHNKVDTLYAPKALTAVSAAPATYAAMDFSSYSLAPDNEAYNVKGELTRKLPDFYNGRLSATVAVGSSRQNDDIRTPLRPNEVGFTSASIVQAAANGVTFNPNNWNGVNGTPTSRATSGMRIDTELLNLALSLHPVDDLNLKGSLRHYETKNKSGIYYAYNPLTGQWGYGNQEGAFNSVSPLASNGVGCQPAPGFTMVAGCTGAAYAAAAFANSRDLASMPRDYKQTNYALSADYDLGNAQSLEGSAEREDFSHTYRERDKTWEDKFKLGYVNTSLENLTLRATFENDRKRGSFYDPLVSTRAGQNWFEVYGITYSRAALQNLITLNGATVNGIVQPTVAQIQNWVLLSGNLNTGGFMKPDQADRNQNILNFRANYAAMENLDIGANVQFKQARYPANTRQLQKEDQDSYNLDLNYQPSAGTQLTAYYSRQEGKQAQIENYGGITGVLVSGAQATLTTYATNICGTLTVNNIDCLLNNSRVPGADVMVETNSSNDVFGIGLQQNLGQMKLGVDYTYTYGKSVVSNAYGPVQVASQTAAQTIIVNTLGSTYPDLITQQNTLAFNLLIPVDKQLSARLSYTYEDFKVKDWHYDYLSITLPGTSLNADQGPQNYHVNTIGVMLNYKM